MSEENEPEDPAPAPCPFCGHVGVLSVFHPLPQRSQIRMMCLGCSACGPKVAIDRVGDRPPFGTEARKAWYAAERAAQRAAIERWNQRRVAVV